MKLWDYVDVVQLEADMVDGYVSRREHSQLPLAIYTYTHAAQWAQHWTDATIKCRGLVVDTKTVEIVARPFSKFFNHGQHDGRFDYAPPLPEGERFAVLEKLDGSLGIVFYYAGQWIVASKGSFNSKQSRWAQQHLDKDPIGGLAYLAKDWTYLCEIIYPENRIVVDYGERADLTLIAAIHTDSGYEYNLGPMASAAWAGFGPIVKMYAPMPLVDLLQAVELNTAPHGAVEDFVEGTDQEGFVIRFESGVRTKVKYADYIRLHRILTGISARDVWRAAGMDLLHELDDRSIARALKCSEEEIIAIRLSVGDRRPRGGTAIEAMVENVPDEFYDWVHDVNRRLTAALGELAYDAHKLYFDSAKVVPQGEHHKREFALLVQAAGASKAVQSAAFLAYEGKSALSVLWSSLYPAAATPFKEDNDV